MSEDPDGPLRASVRAEPIKINDRRKFDKSGQLREDRPRDDDGGGATPPARDARPADRGAPSDAQAAGKKAPAGGKGRTQEPGAVDFQSFIYFLYMSALHELGVPAEPGAPARPADLERARFFVEVLQVIEEKTKGNLSPGESRLLEEALYNLRMQYVGVSRSGPA